MSLSKPMIIITYHYFFKCWGDFDYYVGDFDKCGGELTY